MTSNLLQQLELTSKATSLDIAPAMSSVAKVTTMRGQQLIIPDFQVPLVNPNAIVSNTWNYQADGNFTLALQNGGIQQIKIARGQGSGKTSGKVWLRMNITNNDSAPIQTVPAPFFFSLIQFQTPGGDTVQNIFPFALWFSIISTATEEEWASLSDLILASNNYQSGQSFNAGETKEVWIPLIGNPYSCGEIATRELEGDSICYLNFATPATTIESGSTTDLVINSMSLTFEMQQLDNKLISALDLEYETFTHSFFYPWVMTQDFNQTWNSNTQYSLQLSGITGDVVFLVFVMRDSAQSWDAYHGHPIKDFQIQNQEGIAITGSSLIPDEYNRWAQQTRWFLGTYMQDRKYYAWVFPAQDSSAVEFLHTGRKNGAYGFSGNEQLIIDTAPTGQSEVIDYQTANALALVPGSPQFVYYVWTDEYGVSFSGTGFNLDTATPAIIKANIEAIPNFEGEVTVSAISVTDSFTVTFAGNYANRPLYAKGYSLTLNGTVSTTGPTYTSYGNPFVSTGGIAGITNGGTYTLSVYAFSSAILSVSSKDGTGNKGRQRVQY